MGRWQNNQTSETFKKSYTGKVDVGSKDKYGRTPLSWAAPRWHKTVIRTLHGIVDNSSGHDLIPTGGTFLLPNSVRLWFFEPAEIDGPPVGPDERLHVK